MSRHFRSDVIANYVVKFNDFCKFLDVDPLAILNDCRILTKFGPFTKYHWLIRLTKFSGSSHTHFWFMVNQSKIIHAKLLMLLIIHISLSIYLFASYTLISMCNVHISNRFSVSYHLVYTQIFTLNIYSHMFSLLCEVLNEVGF